MVVTPVLQAIIIGVATLAVGLLTASLWVWRHVESLYSEEDEEKIRELQNERKSSLSDEVKSLYIDINGYLEADPYDEESDLEYEEHVVSVVDNKLNPDELNTLVENAETINEPSNLYNSHREAYESTYRDLAISAVSLFAVNGLVIIALVVGDPPFSSNWNVPIGIVTAAAVVYGWSAKNSFQTARSLKREFDEKWGDYRYKY